MGTHCIHCTRCVRFATEIAGVEALGTTNRGTDTEITTYIKKVFDSEISANVIDICPVGALTSKPYAFNARPWELKTVNGIDLNDSLGSHIRIDLKESEILRILPREFDLVNEEWISNKARFFYDGLKTRRLKKPLLQAKSGVFHFTSWANTLSLFHNFFLNLETLSSARLLSKKCGVPLINSGFLKLANDN